MSLTEQIQAHLLGSLRNFDIKQGGSVQQKSCLKTGKWQ